MASKDFVGISRALDRLERRIVQYRKVLNDMLMDRPMPENSESLAITTGEVETIEALVLKFANDVAGRLPERPEWEPLHPYCKRNEDKKEGWAKQNYEYFRWALLWIQKTRTYIEFLDGSRVDLVRDGASSRSTPEKRTDTMYDVALSFAGEDRAHARKIADLLQSKGLSIFYDEYEQASLWGQNLYTHLSDVYQNKARFCLMFVSASYARKLWTKREREAAQARAFRESEAYILPLRLDDTSLPGLDDTVAYVDLRSTTVDEVVALLLAKIGLSPHE